MLKLLKYFRPYLWVFLLLLGLIYVQVYANLALPDYMARIVNEGIVAKNNANIWHNGYLMLAVSLLGGVAAVGVSFIASKIATGYSKNIRERVFKKVENFSLTEFNKFSTASLITRSTNDVQQIQFVLIMILRLALSAPITGVWAIYKAYHIAPSMTWIMGTAVGLLIAVIFVLFTFAIPKFKILQNLVDKLNLVTRQNLTGLRVIRAFNNEKREQANFEKANVDLTAVNLFVNRMMVIMQPVMLLILNVTTIAIVWIGAHLINTGALQIGDMIAYMQYAMQVIIAFLLISIVFIMVPRASVAADRVAEVLETEPTINDPKEPAEVVKKTGEVEFKDVVFTYPGAEAPVLIDITFTAKPGLTTAFIGSTGSGKSTIVNLIPRFYDVSAGSILIDGVDIRESTQEELRRRIGYVPQKGVLFSGTIKSNIKYGAPEATDQEVERAAKISQAEEFIDTLEDKYDSPIAQGGANVSGGQKQRLSIARAIVKKPEIYIFDDSFSALDFRTDAKLREALKAETQQRTTLIVAQRVSTIMDADNIIVLNEGRIVGMGRHHDLLETCQVYREIATSQLSAEELGLDEETIQELTPAEEKA
ncbi:MAG TPA: ABC transporter ATP-binding protein [Candidatus Saccharimonadales bacterium]|nr:ABC transporter ATP-binding protein [Candidatus Saccharimonadales bacterium]